MILTQVLSLLPNTVTYGSDTVRWLDGEWWAWSATWEEGETYTEIVGDKMYLQEGSERSLLEGRSLASPHSNITKSAKNQNFDQVSKVPPDVDYNKDEFFFLILIPQKTANICLLLHGSPVSHGSLV